MTQKVTCIPVFTAALFTIVKTSRQPPCPLREDWKKKVWYIYRMESYSAIKKNEIMPFVATWVDLEIVILSEVSQTEEKYNIPYMWNLERNETNELPYKRERDSQTWKTNLWLSGGRDS